MRAVGLVVSCAALAAGLASISCRGRGEDEGARANLVATGAPLPVPRISPGETATIGYEVANTGTTGAPEFDIGFYLSTDATLGPDDALVATVDASIEAERVQRASASADLAGVAPGSYRVIMSLDSGSVVDETDETDNVAVSAGTIEVLAMDGPDLFGALDVIDETLFFGETHEIAFVVTNRGNRPVGTDFEAALLVSTDAAPTPDDEHLGVLTIAAGSAPLEPGGATSGVLLATIPAQVSGRHLILHVDAGDAVAESDEGNNVAHRTDAVAHLSGNPDLRAAGTGIAPVAPPIARAGGPVTLNVAYEEIGGAPVPEGIPFEVAVHLSLDPEIDASDVVVDTIVQTGGLAARGAANRAVTVTIPADTPPGKVYLGAIVDSTNRVAEPNEQNNHDSRPGDVAELTVLPPKWAPTEYDLAIDEGPNLFPDMRDGGQLGKLASGARVYVEIGVSNLGGAFPGVVTVGHYLSSDTLVTTDDTLMGSATFTAADLDAVEHGLQHIVVVPDVEPNQTYYYAAIVDTEDVVAEVDESNNIGEHGAFAVVDARDAVVDLVEDGLEVPGVSVMELDETRYLGHLMEVTGTRSPGSFVIRYYIDSDGDSEIETNGDDLEIGSRSYEPGFALNSDPIYPVLTAVTIPSDSIAPGEYHIGYAIDADDAVVEADESNNVYVTESEVLCTRTAVGPDLVVLLGDPQHGQFDGALRAQKGSSFELPQMYYANLGGRATSEAVEVALYASTDASANTSADDTVIGTKLIPSGLGAGQSSWVMGVPVDLSALSVGTYHLFAIVDPDDVVPEIDEDNNDSAHLDMGYGALGFWTVSLTDVAPRADLTSVEVKYMDEYGHFSYQGPESRARKHLYVINASLATAATPSVAALWISTNSNRSIDPGDVFVDARRIGHVGPLVVAEAEFDGELGFDPGLDVPYYLKLEVDALDEVAEEDEGNNVVITEAATFGRPSRGAVSCASNPPARSASRRPPRRAPSTGRSARR